MTVEYVIQVGRANTLIWYSGLNPYNLYGMCDGGVNEDNAEQQIYIPDEMPNLGKNFYGEMMKVRNI